MTEYGLRTVRGMVALKGVEVTGEVLGGHARVRVRQRYVNDEPAAVEAVYTFPLPADATLGAFALECGGRRVEGEVRERDAAFRAYDDALTAGHGAALVERERADVFTLGAGNLLPGEETVVELEYLQRVRVDEGALRVMIPTLVAPRYVPAEEGRVPDAERVSPPRSPAVPYGLRLDLALDLGPDAAVTSPSHAIRVTREGARVRVGFAQGEVALDRDVVLVARDPAAGAGPVTAVAAHRAPGADGYLALTALVDLWSLGADPERGACVVFVLDVSGSMGGDPLCEARRALRLCLRHLREGDRFNVVAFSTAHECFEAAPVAFTQASLDRADRWIDGLRAGGGTEMLAPLGRAVAMARGGAVVLLTDGQVADDEAVLAAVLQRRGDARTRVYAFGVGAAVSDALLRSLARETGGAVEFIHPGERVDEKVVAQFARVVAPRVTDVAVRFEGVDVGEAAPARAPDLVDGEPWTVFARYARGGEGCAVITGSYRGEAFATRVPLALPDEAERPAVAKLWAAERVRDFEAARLEGRRADAMRARIVELAVEHRIASKYTAFVAVERRTGDRRASETPAVRVVPVGLPAGMAAGAYHGAAPAGRRGVTVWDPATRSVVQLPTAPQVGGGSRRLMTVLPQQARTARPAPRGAARAAPSPPRSTPAASVAPGDELAELFARQLASGLWDDPGAGSDPGVRPFVATARVLRDLAARGVDTAHPLHGAALRKALEVLARFAPALAARHAEVVERALALAWLAATGERTRRAVESAARAAGVAARLEGDPAALRAWALAEGP